ncbi:hypothetical protein WME73_11775 [Sorangium sp. So ce302]|uniref:hypothetical protein n=1 Tax=unclassified Sorangium TaxID=2621164 RepID=UPI003F601CBF
MTIRRSERTADADRAPGRQFEGHFSHPQDIQRRLVEEELHLVQSRPITTLYPIPKQVIQARDSGRPVDWN